MIDSLVSAMFFYVRSLTCVREPSWLLQNCATKVSVVVSHNEACFISGSCHFVEGVE